MSVAKKVQDISDPFISVDYWITKADVSITCTYKNGRPNYPYSVELDRATEEKSRIVIFLKTDLVEAYIDTLVDMTTPFILIMASNDDHCAPHVYHPCRSASLKEKCCALLTSPNLLALYAKNPCVTDPKVFPIPIGPKWQWRTTQFFGEPKAKLLATYQSLGLCPDARMRETALKPNLLFLNFSTHTTNAPLYSTHRGIRATILAALGKTFAYVPNKPFDEYMETLGTYAFSVSPPGRGIDAHRTWESLMVGTIPILCTSPLDRLFEGLPVIIVKDGAWDTITPEFLKTERARILSKEYDFGICYTRFWDGILAH
jgi:hypothetical protein